MANYYTIAANGVAFVQDKCMLGLYNGVGSGVTIKVYRAWILNNQTVAQSLNLLNRMSIWRFSTGSGGLAVPALKHDSISPNTPAALVCSQGLNYTKDRLFKQFLWSSDEPIASEGNATLGSSGIDEWETVPALNMCINNSWSYTNTTVEPYILREGYGMGIICDSAWTQVASPVLTAPVGSADFFIEFEMV